MFGAAMLEGRSMCVISVSIPRAKPAAYGRVFSGQIAPWGHRACATEIIGDSDATWERLRYTDTRIRDSCAPSPSMTSSSKMSI